MSKVEGGGGGGGWGLIIVHAVPLQLCIHPIISSVLRKRKKRFAEFFNMRSVAGIGSSSSGQK